MNTQGQTHRHEAGRRSSGKRGARTDTFDIVLLIVTIVVLTCAGAGIVIGFPQALEILAGDANAATAIAVEVQAPQRQQQSAEENGELHEPFFADDIREAGYVYAAAESNAAPAGSKQRPRAATATSAGATDDSFQNHQPGERHVLSH